MSESAELEPWQQHALNQFKGRGTVQITGRNAGKSHWTNQAIKRLMEDLASRPIEDLVLSEGTVYGSRYYCVEPIGGHWVDMEVWCIETFGNCGDNIWGQEMKTPNPGQRWYSNNRKFWFQEQKDRDWFILRWS